ncbi:SDR family oxidoreductase [Paraherbaspirillum soli]|uniref:SDR family oxidoreductase n=1 Tax=Paraherbaspirillum soli TaxID=631222 RepID=A0ABW0MAP9_9BURK
MDKLKGKTVLITGGSSGIGLATAKLFRDRGAHLAITGRDPDSLARALGELGTETLAIRSNAGSLADIESMLEQVKKHFTQLDVLFVNAGDAKPSPIDSVSEAQFDEIIGVHVKGAYFTIQQALPLLSVGRSASIIVTTSITNRTGTPHFSVYGAAKAALRSLVQSLSLELIPRGIRVNAICPGPIDTPGFNRLGLPKETIQAIQQEIAGRSPIKRFGTADEVAKVALFLASDDSAYVVGEEIVVDGGISLVCLP